MFQKIILNVDTTKVFKPNNKVHVFCNHVHMWSIAVYLKKLSTLSTNVLLNLAKIFRED